MGALLSDSIEPSSNDDRRIALRASVSVDAALRKPNSKPFTIAIRDLSRTGCRAESVTKATVGDRVWLTLPGFAAIEGVIRWSNYRGFGCQWVQPLHAAVFDHIRAAHPAMFK